MLRFIRRRTDLIEQMDRPGADPDTLYRTYQRFDRINRIVAGWTETYADYLRPHMTTGGTYTVLDIGCGVCDVSIHLQELAARDGIRLKITAIDPSAFVADLMKRRTLPAGITYRRAYASELVEEGLAFDFVISNHLLHHLSDAEIDQLARHATRMARIRTVFSDLRRSGRAWTAFALFAKPFALGTFAYEDGLASIRRSFTRSELIQTLPDGWSVIFRFPWRLLCVRHERH